MKNQDKTEEQIERARLACRKYYENHKQELNKKRVKYQVTRYHKEEKFRTKRLAYQNAYNHNKKEQRITNKGDNINE